MPVRYVKPSALKTKNPNALCYGCSKEAAGDSKDELWTIWTSTMYYCPRCAKKKVSAPMIFENLLYAPLCPLHPGWSQRHFGSSFDAALQRSLQ